MSDRSRAASGRLALIGATLIWGSSFIILKSTLDSVPTYWILAIRFLGASGLMALVFWKKLKNIGRDALKYGVAVGLTLFAAYTFQTFGLKYTTPGKNAFLTATYCVITPFLAWAFDKKRPCAANAVAAVICMTGMGLVSLDGEMRLGLGDGLTICCGFFYALQLVFTARAVQTTVGVAELNILQFAVAGVLCLIAAPIEAPFPDTIPPSALLSIAYLCVMCTGVCFLLQAYGQRHTSSQSAAIILTLESVFGTLLSMIFYHERLTPRVALGFALIFAAVLISETKPSLKLRKNAKVS